MGFGGGLNAGPGKATLMIPGGKIDLPTGKVTDAGMQHLKGLTGLADLEIGDWNLTDTGVDALQGLTDLKHLTLASPEITDKALAALAKMNQLEVLDLRCTPITSVTAAEAKNWPKLKTLYVSITSSDADLTRCRQVVPRGARVSRGDLFEQLGQLGFGLPNPLGGKK